MKILFVNPPRFNELIGKNPGIVEENRGFNPPLGILTLATTVKKVMGDKHDVSVLDCQPTLMTYEDIGEYFEKNHYDLIGLNAMTFTLIDIVKTVKVIKAKNPDCIIVLGGPHVHLYPEETINLPGVDYLILGEGEVALIEFLKALDGELPKSEVLGLVYLENGSIKNNGMADKIPSLDDLVFPDRRFLPVHQYGSLLAKENIITTMFTSRGCPYRCKFCDRPSSPVYSGFRWRSAKSVVDEIQDCYDLGIREILIYDDTFTVRRDRVMAICDEILARGLKIKWEVRAHVNTMDREMIKLMKRAGCLRIHYGVECGNDRMLKIIQKNATIKTIKKVFKETMEEGIETLGYFMVGQQTETLSDVHDTMRLSKELNPDYSHFTIFCPYPGTEIYNKGLEQGVISYDIWKEFSKDPQPGFQLPVWEENFKRNELYDLVVKCYKNFYMRPTYVLKKMADIRSLGELRRKVTAGLSVVHMKSSNVAKLDLSKALKVKVS